jgi:lipopolysaccharide biosynthesis glycosyltransferase
LSFGDKCVAVVIFVDSDQVVRTDLAELFNQDLKVSDEPFLSTEDRRIALLVVIRSYTQTWIELCNMDLYTR